MSEGDLKDRTICMVGTDHNLSSVEARAKLVLTPEERDFALPSARARLGAAGVVLLATCNRVELWASFDGVEAPVRHLNDDGTPQQNDPLLEAICALHNVRTDEYAGCFVCREGDAAVSHLFQVACGLRSAIIAEDQIISQVKKSLAQSRTLGLADSCTEVLFRQAITAAKQVKSGVRFSRAHATAVEQAISEMGDKGIDLARSTCMVIGNGEYGRLAASSLVASGARVLVTVRRYTHGEVSIPSGCEPIAYSERYRHLGDCDVVMSATASPHFTLVHDKVAASLDSGHALEIVDLAVPRDIDPAISEIPGCSVRDIDSFATRLSAENERAIASARQILDAGLADFWDWMRRRTEHAAMKPPAPLFPLFTDISEQHVVFIGGGAVALRRVRTLLPFAGDITVYAPDFSPELESFAADGAVTLVRKAYEPSMLDDADIVIACTNDTSVNDGVWAECRSRGVMVNVCSDRYKCDFHFPGIVQRENVVIGVNAGGKEHRRVKQLRARIDRLMDEEDI